MKQTLCIIVQSGSSGSQPIKMLYVTKKLNARKITMFVKKEQKLCIERSTISQEESRIGHLNIVALMLAQDIE